MRKVLKSEIAKERPNQSWLAGYNSAVESGMIDAGDKLPEDLKEEFDKVIAEFKGEDGKTYEVTVKDIFNSVSSINPTSNEMSSIGEYISEQKQQLADSKVNELIKLVPKDSTAYKILLGTRGRFSDKQIWAVSYELQKNKSYAQKVGKEVFDSRVKSQRKANENNSKLSANKSASQNVLDHIKKSKAKLGDYYKWLNTPGNPFRKEKFNKKYTMASANDFLNK